MAARRDESDIRQSEQAAAKAEEARRSKPLRRETMETLKNAYLDMETDAKYVFRERG